MLLHRVWVACGLFIVAAAGADACEMAGFKGLDGLRLHRPAPGAVVSGFGMRQHPLLPVARLHNGLDFAAAAGQPVEAAARGRVASAGRQGEYGNMVRIDHGGGLVTLYGHLSRVAVQAGDCVGQGTVIGLAGSTGLTARLMLHFELRVAGKPVDPAPAIGDGPR